MPEEINRRIVDHTSDINLTYSSIAREYLLREGFPPDQIIKTGSPMLEVLEHYNAKIEKSDAMKRFGLQYKNYFLVSIHREENVEPDSSFAKIVNVLNEIANIYKLPIIVSTHPRTQKRIDQSSIKFAKSILFVKPLGFVIM